MVKQNALPSLSEAPRKLNMRIYVIAFIFSAVLFVAGVLLGLQLASQVTSDFSRQADTLSQNTQQLEVMLLLASQGANDSKAICPVLLQQAKGFDSQTTEFGISLDALEKNRGISDSQVQFLKRNYSQMQVRDYLLLKEVANQCNTKVNQIIFFYTNLDCTDCGRQGQVLHKFKVENPTVFIYTLDVDINTPITQTLVQAYGIPSYPAMIVNGQVVMGLRDSSQISKMLYPQG